LTDVEREEGVFFGTEGILASLHSSGGALKERCGALLDEAQRFGAGKAQPDDLSILALRRLA
jgi:serine phosphatase RsbU (regulator of sigma subunit)